MRPGRTATGAALTLLLALVAAAPAGAVIDGRRVAPEAYPQVVALDGTCSGALIAPDRVLTAGHCADQLRAGFGVRFAGRAAGGARYVVTRIVTAPGYRYQAGRVPAEPLNDLALAQLDRPVVGVAPLELDERVVRQGERLRLAGYGTTAPSRPIFGTLRAADVVSLSNTTCRRALRRRDAEQGSQLRAHMLCTRGRTGPPFASGCFGDSGAPLLRRDRGGWRIVGVDSWGLACGTDRGDPEVFVRVAPFLAFLRGPLPAP
ncbi:serine protease [Patulibacter brassicae]|jgi:secreted trypsin-like serine protease|uniref:Serine protease n=1 Tax=Patulibacter brassicae TaxID=1705717 RepID=A0ABU4VI52_9ACTN|nr:serine protease [Patulibacter brassicae]MDX8151495.1 serine protease [Patulibacter brassicae]